MTVRRAYRLQATEVSQGWWPWGVTMEVSVCLYGIELDRSRVWGRSKAHALRAAIRRGKHLAKRHHRLHGYAPSVHYVPRSTR